MQPPSADKPAPSGHPAVGEVARQMQICNACRYCETYCAVFPAMTRRLQFPPGDVHYLANLCHGCGACLHACQYAPPHEFAVNVPRAMAAVRAETYAGYAWPGAFAALYRRNGLVVAAAVTAALVLVLMLALGVGTEGSLFSAVPGGNFYAVLPHGTMAWLFGLTFGWALVALGIGGARFWRAQAPGSIRAASVNEAARHALSLSYLDGGHGDGCNEGDDRFTPWRRRFHHLTFYGFMLCFAATSVATLYHYALGWPAPYPMASAPVLLGIAGGIGLLFGPAGLWWLNARRQPLQGDPAQQGMDRGLIALLFATSATGLALLLARETAAMGLLLVVHLGAVLALFVTMPYGKFAHAVYRCAALLKWAIERRQPNPLQLGTD
jgi:citrate/tricarballylate utilization protein